MIPKTMKAVVLTGLTPAEEVRLTDAPVPEMPSRLGTGKGQSLRPEPL